MRDLKIVLESKLQSELDKGKYILGKKTTIDAVLPIIKPHKTAGNESLLHTLQKTSESVRKGAESTVALIAIKRRAHYLGKRSKNHKDPG